MKTVYVEDGQVAIQVPEEVLEDQQKLMEYMYDAGFHVGYGQVKEHTTII